MVYKFDANGEVWAAKKIDDFLVVGSTQASVDEFHKRLTKIQGKSPGNADEVFGMAHTKSNRRCHNSHPTGHGGNHGTDSRYG